MLAAHCRRFIECLCDHCCLTVENSWIPRKSLQSTPFSIGSACGTAESAVPALAPPPQSGLSHRRGYPSRSTVSRRQATQMLDHSRQEDRPPRPAAAEHAARMVASVRSDLTDRSRRRTLHGRTATLATTTTSATGPSPAPRLPTTTTVRTPEPELRWHLIGGAAYAAQCE